MERPSTVSFLDGYGVSIHQGLPLGVQVARERSRFDNGGSPARVTMSGGHVWGRHSSHRTNDSDALLGEILVSEMEPSEDEPAAQHDGAALIPDLVSKPLWLREEQESQAAVSQSWRDAQDKVLLPQPSDSRVRSSTDPPTPFLPRHNDVSAVDDVMEGKDRQSRHPEPAQSGAESLQFTKTFLDKRSEEGEAPSSNAASSHFKYLPEKMVSSSLPRRPSADVFEQSAEATSPSSDAELETMVSPSLPRRLSADVFEQSAEATSPSSKAELELVHIDGLQLEQAPSPASRKRKNETKPQQQLSSNVPSTCEASEPRAIEEIQNFRSPSLPASLTADAQAIHLDDAGGFQISPPPSQKPEPLDLEISDGTGVARVAFLVPERAELGQSPEAKILTRSSSSPEPRRMSNAGLNMSMSPPPALLRKSSLRRKKEEEQKNEDEQQRDESEKSMFRPTDHVQERGLDWQKLADRIRVQEVEYEEAKRRYDDANDEYERVKFLARKREAARKNLRLFKDSLEQCEYDLRHSRLLFQKMSKASRGLFTR